MTPSQLADAYCATTGGVLQAALIRNDIMILQAVNGLMATIQSKYQLPRFDASSVGEGSSPLTMGNIIARAWSNIAVTNDIAPDGNGANWRYLLYPRSYNPATWSGPAPFWITSPEIGMRWQIIVAQTRPVMATVLKSALADQIRLVKECEASVASWDMADRVFTGIATFGASELIAVAKTKIQAAKDKVAEYQTLRTQAQAYLADPKCPADVKKQISDSMKYDDLLGLLVGGKVSPAEGMAALAKENVDPATAAELQAAMGKTPADAQGMGLDMGAVWAAQQDDAARGLGFAPLAALAAIPVGTMVCVAIIVAIVAGLAIYLLGPALRAAGVAMEAIAKATGKVVDTLGGPGLVAVLAIAGAGYYFYKNPGQWGQVKRKLHLA